MEKTSKNDSAKTVIVIGGGIGGLYSAWKLLKKGFQVVVIEKQNQLGGLSTSILYKEYKMDIGPHFMTMPKNTELTKQIEDLMKDDIIYIPDIHKWYRVFFKNSILKEYPPLYQVIFNNGLNSFLLSFFSYLKSKIKYSLINSNFESAEEYVIGNYGKYLYKTWFKPYLDFNYGRNNHSITIVQGKFPPLKLLEILEKISKKKKYEVGTSATCQVNYCYFKYGMGTLADKLTKEIEGLGGKIIVSADVKNINHNNIQKEILIVRNNKEKKLFADIILYAVSPNITKRWFNDFIENGDTAKNLSHGILVYLFINKMEIFDWWLMTNYEPSFSFFRITQQSYLSRFVAPKGKSLLCIEINTKEKEYLWELENEELFKKIKDELAQIKVFDTNQIEDYKILKFKNLYHVPESNGNVLTEKLSSTIDSMENEYMIGVEIDPGTLVTKRVEDSANSEIDNISLGGIYMTLEQSKHVIENIIAQKKRI
jgi:protoporphyrinogen oxidase